MKTKLPSSITSVDEAKTFLSDLFNNGESYHPEDSAHEVSWETAEPTEEEKDQLDKLMADIHRLPLDLRPSFDPCDYLLSLSKSLDATFVKSLRTENTGGYVMVDFLTLNDGRLLAISEGGIGLYRDLEHFDSGEEPINFIDR